MSIATRPQEVPERASRRRRPRVWLIAVALIWAGATTAASETPSPEYQVKASYLYHFLQFTEWKQDAVQDRGRWVVCVVGPDPFGQALDALEGEVVRQRSIAVQRHQSWAGVEICHIAFIGGTIDHAGRRKLAELRERPILTVGETDEFVEQGGIVRFLLENNRVRFRIDADSAERAGLKVGSQLLRLGAHR